MTRAPRLLASLQYNGRLEFLRTAADNCVLRSDKATLVTLIVREAVTNAIKYAHPTGIPGRITVACSRDSEGTIAVEVADDGVGLPEDFDPATDGATGFRVMRALSQRLEATLAFKINEPGAARALASSARRTGGQGSPTREMVQPTASSEIQQCEGPRSAHERSAARRAAVLSTSRCLAGRRLHHGRRRAHHLLQRSRGEALGVPPRVGQERVLWILEALPV